jgi:hypothetical protein
MSRAAAARVHLCGIRHHGPGSARSLVSALAALDPAAVLIEGPADASDIIEFSGSAAMRPPVAVLVHAQEDPANAIFYPLTEFSPEWQAMRWALARGRPVRFIDLPAAARLAMVAAEVEQTAEGATAVPDPVASEAAEQTPPGEVDAISRDPLAHLAGIAGYDDGEAWWNALVEQVGHAPTIFGAIETAITELRACLDPLAGRSSREQRIEDQREAHMRLAIASALGTTEGPVVVVCGAWHVPALRRGAGASEDRALLKGLPKLKVAATWVPWTDTRLAAASGYGAGVRSPAWYGHLWSEFERHGGDLSPRSFTARWLARAAELLRASGRQTSTATVIEATRLAETLASLRDLALPGLDEMRDASLATLCLGEAVPWRLIESELVIGSGVGEIADDVPQMPLQADLTRWQRKLKLKPEALDRELSLDLRSDAGLAKSLLLHRLNLITVPWGRLLDAGGSRGTFRENWRLRWDPEFSVRLVEALVHGTTVEQAAGNAAVAAARQAASFADISNAVKGCLLAGLTEAAREAIGILQGAAAATSDLAALAGAIPPLVSVLRYGTARDMPAEELRLIVTSLTEAVCSGIVYACRNLQEGAADTIGARLAEFDRSLVLLEDEHLSADWRRALRKLADDADVHGLLRGLAVRALYEQGVIEAAATGSHLSRALSRAVPPIEAGRWLEGFLGQSGHVLIYDTALSRLIDGWIAELPADDFIVLLPMLRRAFASIDRVERRRLLDMLRRPPDGPAGTADESEATAPGFSAALPLLLTILGIHDGVAGDER